MFLLLQRQLNTLLLLAAVAVAVFLPQLVLAEAAQADFVQQQGFQ
jgi:hypothetical protein